MRATGCNAGAVLAASDGPLWRDQLGPRASTPWRRVGHRRGGPHIRPRGLFFWKIFLDFRGARYNLAMRRFVIYALLCAGAAAAQTWNGTLVDVMCKGKDLAGHTTKCAVACAKSGYGVVLADGKFVKFDEGGNAKTLAALKTATKEKDLKVTVTGSLADDDTIQVSSIDLK